MILSYCSREVKGRVVVEGDGELPFELRELVVGAV